MNGNERRMTNYVLIWKSRKDNKITYFSDYENSLEVCSITSTDQLGEAKVFSRHVDAEFERHYAVRFSNEIITTIEVSDRELFEARLKGE